ELTCFGADLLPGRVGVVDQHLPPARRIHRAHRVEQHPFGAADRRRVGEVDDGSPHPEPCPAPRSPASSPATTAVGAPALRRCESVTPSPRTVPLLQSSDRAASTPDQKKWSITNRYMVSSREKRRASASSTARTSVPEMAGTILVARSSA